MNTKPNTNTDTDTDTDRTNEIRSHFESILKNSPSNISAVREKRTEILEIAMLIRAWRKDSGLTQEKLALLVNERNGDTKMKQETISRLESYDNNHIPELSTLIDIAHACGRHLFLGGLDNSAIPPKSNKEIYTEDENTMIAINL